jgi:hypothetical protein
LLTPTERAAAELEIALAPNAWPVIRGTGGCPQGAGSTRGTRQSGGVRIIYFVVSRRGVIYMIDIYAKSEKEDLTDAERREIQKLVVALEAEGCALGRRLVAGLSEALAHARGEIELPSYTVTVPDRVDVAKLRHRLGLSQSALRMHSGWT